MEKHIPPEFQLTAFNCPHCEAFAHQEWYPIYYESRGFTELKGVDVCICTHCGKITLWHGRKMVFPDSSLAPLPNADLTEDIKRDFQEARSIITRSPRGAAALLRLCVQKLCRQLDEKGENLNDDIASLVRKGLPPTIQKSLDIVRVTGNNAVHPGEIDLKDSVETAVSICRLINLVADVMITKPTEITETYEALPESDKKAIEKRDKTEGTA